jgi:class 3 adenylate cyclase
MTGVVAPPADPAEDLTMPENSYLPYYRCIIAVDVEGSTDKVNTAKAHIRQAMYALFESALLAAGITEEYRDPLIDRGDGVFALVHPADQVPKTVILDTFVPRLAELLAGHAEQYPEVPLRMRVAIHAGEVHFDGKGCYGEALDQTFRLLDAATVKRTLKQSSAPLVLVVSNDIYQSVVRHGYANIDKDDYRPGVTVRLAGQQVKGWLRTPCPAGEETSCRATGSASLTRLRMRPQRLERKTA